MVLPHFPNPRAEHAAAIISGDIDGVEMTSWRHFTAASTLTRLSDWYRYLNCGHFVAAVGGTDKMQATTAVGTVRTYARVCPRSALQLRGLERGSSVRDDTFVTYGPLMEFPGRRAAGQQYPGCGLAVEPSDVVGRSRASPCPCRGGAGGQRRDSREHPGGEPGKEQRDR